MKDPDRASVELEEISMPPPDLDEGIITSGSCPTEEEQKRFDAEQAGKPPMVE